MLPSSRGPGVLAAILLCAASVARAAPAAPKDPSRAVEAKVALEASLEKRLEGVLRGVLGSEDVAAIVNVSLLAPPEGEPEADALPGVPPKQASAAPPDAALPLIGRITARVLVDEGLEEADIRLVRQVSEGLLGVSPERGDSVAVEKTRFHKKTAPKDPLRFVPAVAQALWLLVALGALALLSRKFFEPFSAQLRDLSAALLARQKADAAAPASSSASAAPERAAEALGPAAPPAAPAPARPPLPFAGFREDELPRLAFVLSCADAATAATVIHYLSPAVAAGALESLAPEVRREVVSLLGRVDLLDETDVRALEETVRRSVDFSRGGPERLSELLAGLPPSLQAELLESVRGRDAELARALERRLLFVEDLAHLDAAELKLLSRHVSTRTLAAVVKSSPALREGLLPKLSAGMREWLTQEMELSGELPEKTVEEARRAILAALGRLVREGRVAAPRREA